MVQNAVFLAVLSGILGTGIGGLFATFPGIGKKRMEPMLHFTAGVMLGMSFFDLLPEALELGSWWVIAAGLLCGVMLVWLAEALEKLGENRGKKDVADKKMAKTGIVVLLALMLHNLPEGFVIGAGFENNMAVSRAWLIAMHNIPGGLAVALPMIQSGMKNIKAVLLAALSGVPLVIGAALGGFCGELPSIVTALFLATAAGSMLFASCYELSVQKDERKNFWGLPAACLLAGLFLAYVLTSFHIH